MPQRRIRRYLRHGTLPQLAVFDAIARLGSFTRAGAELHLAQSTVSTQMRKLTDMIGTPLVEQVGRTIRLTEAGRRLQRSCAELFECLERAEASLAELRVEGGGRLALAVSSNATYFVPRLLAAFGQRHPGIDIALAAHGRVELLARMARNEDDLYIVAHPPAEGMVTQQIMPNPSVVVARSDHPLAGERRVSFARIAAEPFIAREPASGTRRIAERAFELRGLAPRTRLEVSSNEAVKQAILAGAGVSILSRCVLSADLESGRLAVLDVEGFPLPGYWHFAYPAGRELSVTARAFIDFVRAEAPALEGEAAAVSCC